MQSLMSMQTNIPIKAIIMAIGMLITIMTCSCKESDIEVDSFDASVFRGEVYDFLTINGIDTTLIVSGTIGAYPFYYYPIALNSQGKTQAEGNVLAIEYQLSVLTGDTLAHYSNDHLVYYLGQVMQAIFPVGLDEALITSNIKEGEEYAYIIPPALGYSDLSLGDFQTLLPANSILNFQVKLDSIGALFDVPSFQSQMLNNYINNSALNDTSRWGDRDGLVYRADNSHLVMKIMDSAYTISPVEGNTISLSYVLYDLTDSSLVLDRRTASNPFIFELGDESVLEGLDQAVRLMHLNEKALVLLTSDLAYKESVAVFPDYSGLIKILTEQNILPSYAAKIKPFQILRFEAYIESID